MKLSLYLLLITCLVSNSQNVVFYQTANTYATLGNNTTLYIKGGYETYGKINNGNKVYITGDLINHSLEPKVFGNTGTVVLTDSMIQRINGERKIIFNKLLLDKSDHHVVLKQSIGIDSILTLLSGNIDLDSSNITFKDYVGKLVNETHQNHVYSNSSGKLFAKVLLDPSQSNVNLAGLGLFVEVPAFSMGATYIERGHYAWLDAGKGSIRRFYTINPSIPAVGVGDVKSVKMAYHNDEVLGYVTEEADLELYQKDNYKSNWLSKGGIVNIAHDTIYSDAVYIIPSLSNMFTAATQNKVSSCGSKDPNYVNVRYLVASEAFEGDTVHFVNLSSSNKKITRNEWVFGDGTELDQEDVTHIYNKENTYHTSLRVSNPNCNNYLIKSITVKPDALRKELQEVASNIFITPIGYYPNPTTDFLYFYTELNQSLISSLSLVDQWGRNHFKKDYTQAQIREVMDFSHLASGLYLLRFVVLEKSYTYKIIKN